MARAWRTWWVAAATAALTVAMAVGCGDDDVTPAGASGTAGTIATVCDPGAQVTCACPGGGDGAQACNPDGTGYLACDCGSAGSSGTAGAGGTSGTAGTGGTAGDAGSSGNAGSAGVADPLPAGTYQLSCLWRPLGLPPAHPERARVDVTGTDQKKIELTWFGEGTTELPAHGNEATSSSVTLSPEGVVQIAFSDFSIAKDHTTEQSLYIVTGYGLAGHVSQGQGCFEASGMLQLIPDEGENPPATELAPTGDVCLLVPAAADGSANVPADDAYGCTP